MIRNYPLCLDCGRKLKEYRSKRCRKCNATNRFSSKRITKPCMRCGKLFLSVLWKKQKVCSIKCTGQFKLPLPIKYCELCKNQIKISPKGNITYFRTRRFCSPHCRGVYNARNRRGIPVSGVGKDHWAWKGGKGTERHKLMRREPYRFWRRAVFERDNYTCQKCGITGIKMNADHIKGWSKYPALRYDINNGRTLCYKCHYEITFRRKIPPNVLWG